MELTEDIEKNYNYPFNLILNVDNLKKALHLRIIKYLMKI